MFYRGMDLKSNSTVSKHFLRNTLNLNKNIEGLCTYGDMSVISDDLSCHSHIFIRGFQCSNQFLNLFDEGVIPNFDILEYDAATPSRF
jgi:hypothetical protein